MKMPRFSLSIIACIVVVFIGQYFLLTNQIEKTIVESITHSAQAANATTTKLFINEVYPRLAEELNITQQSEGDSLTLSDRELNNVDDTIRAFMFGTDVLKVKIFNIWGRTVYSSDPNQIGEFYDKNLPFITAVQGQPASQISHRGTFSALDGEVYERDLVSSYIPIHNNKGIIVGVTEIYSDRTRILEESQKDMEWVDAILVLCFIFNFVLVVVLAWSYWWYITGVHPLPFGAESRVMSAN